MKHFSIKPIVTACAITVACAGTPVFAESADGRSSDMWNKAAITTTFTLNRHLNPFDIETDVENGVATLRGTVESDIERDLAEELALGVEGIRDVNNELKVSPDAAEKHARENTEGGSERSFMLKVDDANLTAKVKSQLLWNSNTSGLAIDVDTHNGIVTLSGTVDSADEADLAEQIAHNTKDVLEVENNLKTSGKNDDIGDKVAQETRAAGQQVSDGWITAKVKSALMYSRNVDGTDINVDTKNGVVTLHGQVDSDYERKQALQIANGIKGVKEVNAELSGSMQEDEKTM